MGYTRKAFLGFSWFGTLKVFIEGLSVTKIIVLSRVLTPRDFGIFGLTIAALALAERLTETGINTFLIQKKDSLSVYLNSAWVIALIRGVFIAILLIAASIVLPGFYNEPSLGFFLIVASLVPFVKGAINPAEITFWKNMEYHKEAMFRGFLTLLETAASIYFTLTLRSPIGLIYAILLSAVVEVILSHTLIQPRPFFQANIQRIKEVLHASKWLNLSVVFSFLANTIDNLIVGKVLGTEQLGYYQNGFNVASSTTGDLGDLAAQTVFPIYTSIRGDKKRLSFAFLRSFVFLAIILAIPPGIILINPTWAVQLVLGAKWLPIVPLLPVLLAAMYIKALNGIMYPLFLAVEHAERNVMILTVQVVALVAFIIPFAQYAGLLGASYAVLGSYVLIQPRFVYFVNKTLKEA